MMELFHHLNVNHTHTVFVCSEVLHSRPENIREFAAGDVTASYNINYKYCHFSCLTHLYSC